MNSVWKRWVQIVLERFHTLHEAHHLTFLRSNRQGALWSSLGPIVISMPMSLSIIAKSCCSPLFKTMAGRATNIIILADCHVETLILSFSKATPKTIWWGFFDLLVGFFCSNTNRYISATEYWSFNVQKFLTCFLSWRSSFLYFSNFWACDYYQCNFMWKSYFVQLLLLLNLLFVIIFWSISFYSVEV